MTVKEKKVMNCFFCEGRVAHYKGIPFAGIFMRPEYKRMSAKARVHFQQGYEARQNALGKV